MCQNCGCDWCLQMTQIILYVTTCATGLSVALSLGWTWVIMGDHCILGSNMVIRESPLNTTLYVEMESSVWGADKVCSYCTYTSVCTSIYSIIWFWCYLLVSDWSRQKSPWDFRDRGRQPPDVRILWPSLIGNLPLFGCAVASAILLSNGREVWCSFIKQDFKHSCEYVRTKEWSNIHSGQNVFDYSSTAVSCGWLLVFSMSATLLVILIRLRRYKMEHNTNTKQKLEIKKSVLQMKSTDSEPENSTNGSKQDRGVRGNVYIKEDDDNGRAIYDNYEDDIDPQPLRFTEV